MLEKLALGEFALEFILLKNELLLSVPYVRCGWRRK